MHVSRIRSMTDNAIIALRPTRQIKINTKSINMNVIQIAQ